MNEALKKTRRGEALWKRREARNTMDDQSTRRELAEYRFRVKQAAQSRLGEPIFNGSTEHAQIVLETLFDSANSAVNILSESLHDGVYAQLPTVDAFRKFVTKPGAKARILIERNRDGLECHPLLQAAREANADLEIRVLPVEARNWFDFHLTTVDGESYRFEPDKRTHAAVAAFGNQATAQHLDGVFEQLWEHGTVIQ